MTIIGNTRHPTGPPETDTQAQTDRQTVLETDKDRESEGDIDTGRQRHTKSLTGEVKSGIPCASARPRPTGTTRGPSVWVKSMHGMAALPQQASSRVVRHQASARDPPPSLGPGRAGLGPKGQLRASIHTEGPVGRPGLARCSQRTMCMRASAHTSGRAPQCGARPDVVWAPHYVQCSGRRWQRAGEHRGRRWRTMAPTTSHSTSAPRPGRRPLL